MTKRKNAPGAGRPRLPKGKSPSVSQGISLPADMWTWLRKQPNGASQTVKSAVRGIM